MTYECNGQKRQAQSKRACLHVSCPPLDNAISERVLQAVNTNHLALALAAHDELTQRDEAVLKQWQMRCSVPSTMPTSPNAATSKWTPPPARGRFPGVPLERIAPTSGRGPSAARRLSAATDAYVYPQQREQILALARNLPRLWQAETTSAKDRKRLLRLLIQDITVERGPGGEVQLHVRWIGGECEDLLVTLPAKIQDRLRYPPERIKEIRGLAAEHTDAEIAEVFNQRGQPSSRGQPFTAKMIGWIRGQHRIPAVVLDGQTS